MKTNTLLTVLFTGLSFAAYSQWVSQASIPYSVGQSSAIAAPNGNVYLIGGYNNSSATLDSTGVFTEGSNTWSSAPHIPTPTRGPAYALGKDSMIYIFGGYYTGTNDSCYKFNPYTNTWKSIAPMPSRKWFAEAATDTNGTICVIGGEDSMGNTSANVQLYNPVSNTWSSGTPLPLAVEGAGTLTAANGSIYVIGGINTLGSVVDSVQVYNPYTNTWSRGNPMPTSRWQFAYAADNAHNTIYCMGGKTMYGNHQLPFLNVVEIYNTFTNTWSAGSPLPNGLGETSAAYVNGGINVFGGADSANSYCTHNFRVTPPALALNNEQGPAQAVTVYPNPASSNLYVNMQNPSGVNFISIINAIGQTMMQMQSDQTAITIPVQNLNPGIYFLRIVNQQGNMVVKKVCID